MGKTFDGMRLKEARLFNQYSITDLSEKLGVTKQMVSKYENGKSEPSFEKSLLLFKVLGYPREFFYTSENFKFKTEGTFFRSRLTATKKSKIPAEFLLKYAIITRHFLEKYIEFPKLEDREIFENISSPDEGASLARKLLSNPDEPIEDIIEVAELLGITVAQYKYSGSKVDAFSSMCSMDDTDYFIIVIGNDSSFYRRQFSMAHEIGHWILHQEIDPKELNKEEYREMEKEANNFAASFLLPEKEFLADLEEYGTELDAFLNLKLKWNVSIAAMIERATNLEKIDNFEKVKLYKKMNNKGWRNPEPYDLETSVSEPPALNEAVNLLIEEEIFTGYEIRKKLMSEFNLHIPQYMLAEVCNVEQYLFDDINKSKLKLKIRSFSNHDINNN